MSNKHVEIWTDGACSMPNRNGGCAAILCYKWQTKEFSYGQLNTTNNQMELKAVILGLSKLKQVVNVTLYSDSKYVINGIKSWLAGWKRNGWRTADGKPVKNSELWKQIDELIKTKTSSILPLWVKAHDGNEMNEVVNDLAQAARDNIKNKTLAIARREGRL